jgi:GMP synthase (glutamine-hydrolysing)
VIQPDPVAPLDRFLPWFEAKDLTVDLMQPFDGEALPPRLEHEALVVLGGSMSAWHDSEHPWLEDIRRLFREAVEHRRPALGICLGAQLMAQAFGGTVTKGQRGVEAGVVEVSLRPEARDDVLLALMPDPFPSGAMHADSITQLPSGAAWLGSSGQYDHQAFRYGTCAWGVQFHPEVSLRTYASWIDVIAAEGPEALDRVREGATQLELRDDEVTAACADLAAAFARIVHAERHLIRDSPGG